ncbi:hypothetical protein EV127DRAFT_517655 [Xylaria flabelliformis]|nr:hypothetical protein EV127DRAFT_517655 [Xylaria flabelliformis]
MDLAMVAMRIANKDGSDMSAPMRAFARDTLSIEIEGPSRPQLTLVDIPGLIHASTKGVSDADVALVDEITEHYISQPRTICLAANDVANQTILTKKDSRSFLISYNHYYTDTIFKRRQERQKLSLAEALNSGVNRSGDTYKCMGGWSVLPSLVSTSGIEHRKLPGCTSGHTSAEVNIEKVIAGFTEYVDPIWKISVVKMHSTAYLPSTNPAPPS